jgi:hypothetical protein
MTKYQPLRNYLTARQYMERVRLTFREVVNVLDEPLPSSAYHHREWWANQSDTAKRQWAAAWLDAGFVVDAVHQAPTDLDGWVEFVRR